MKRNILAGIPAHLADELVEMLAQSGNIRIERIVSRGHSSSKGFWYDQETNEFVLLIKGSAALTFQDKDEPVIMKPGDYLDIKAHVKHRVEWTDNEVDSIWLAVHY